MKFYRHRQDILFVLLICVVLIIGALTFFPAFASGPIVEHFMMHSSKLMF